MNRNFSPRNESFDRGTKRPHTLNRGNNSNHPNKYRKWNEGSHNGGSNRSISNLPSVFKFSWTHFQEKTYVDKIIAEEGADLDKPFSVESFMKDMLIPHSNTDNDRLCREQKSFTKETFKDCKVSDNQSIPKFKCEELETYFSQMAEKIAEQKKSQSSPESLEALRQQKLLIVALVQSLPSHKFIFKVSRLYLHTA